MSFMLRNVGYAREAAFGLSMGGMLNIGLDPLFMFLSFNMVNFMQAVNRGKESFWLAAIRQIGLTTPILFLMNSLFGMMGVVWTQAVADILNVIVSYIIYGMVMRKIVGRGSN